MPDPKKISYLLKLVGDESPVVRDAVWRELAAFGPDLEAAVSGSGVELDEETRAALKEILERHKKDALKRDWAACLGVDDALLKLEAALDLLSAYQVPENKGKLIAELDALEKEFASTPEPRDVFGLARFLFDSKGLKGASSTDYYNPRNSDLVFVIREKRGLPISLSLVYILLGRRLGLDVQGCNLPGHFMAKIASGGKVILVDCFDGGRLIDEAMLGGMVDTESAAVIDEIIHQDVNPDMILARVVSNLINAYSNVHDEPNAQLMIDLLEILENRKG